MIWALQKGETPHLNRDLLLPEIISEGWMHKR